MFNSTYEGKKEFVEAIAALLKKEEGSDVINITYDYDSSAGLEVVEIIYYGGHTSKVNVTMNSNGAIFREIAAEVYGNGAFGRMRS